MYWYEGIAEKAAIQLTPEERDSLEELRLRANRPAIAIGSGWQRKLDWAITPNECREYLAQLGGHSLYAAERNLKQGFFTLEGGCRVGFCGQASLSEGVKVTSPMYFCIRIAREIKSAAQWVMPYIIQNNRALSTLIISPPGEGKTTLLRDAARRLSDGIGCMEHKVAIVDERSELCGCDQGVPTLDVGSNTDVMDGAPKAICMELMIRTMSPQVIVADEIGREEDVQAVEDAVRTGVRVIVSAHGDELYRTLSRPALMRLKGLGVFERYVLLEQKRIAGVWDKDLKRICGGTDEKCTDAGGVCVLYSGRTEGSAQTLCHLRRAGPDVIRAQEADSKH